MKTFATLAVGTCMTIAFAGAGFAQSSMSNMTAAEKTTATKCKGLSPSAMQQDAQCTALMKKYPDLNTGGTTGSSAGSSTSPSSPSATTPPASK